MMYHFCLSIGVHIMYFVYLVVALSRNDFECFVNISGYH